MQQQQQGRQLRQGLVGEQSGGLSLDEQKEQQRDAELKQADEDLENLAAEAEQSEDPAIQSSASKLRGFLKVNQEQRVAARSKAEAEKAMRAVAEASLLQQGFGSVPPFGEQVQQKQRQQSMPAPFAAQQLQQHAQQPIQSAAQHGMQQLAQPQLFLQQPMQAQAQQAQPFFAAQPQSLPFGLQTPPQPIRQSPGVLFALLNSPPQQFSQQQLYGQSYLQNYQPLQQSFYLTSVRICTESHFLDSTSKLCANDCSMLQAMLGDVIDRWSIKTDRICG